MAREASGLIVAFDTASDIAGLALLDGGALLAEVTWHSRQNQSRELLPTLDWLLQRHGRSKHDLSGVVASLGPGSYAGLRVGISTAKALAFGLEMPLVGVGRLAADAYEPAAAASGRVIAVQVAGRAELAWAAYSREGEALTELLSPRLSPAEGLIEAVRPGDVLCGEMERLDAGVREALSQQGARLAGLSSARVAAVAQLGWQRLQADEFDNLDTLVPLYLRAPAIGPQPPR